MLSLLKTSVAVPIIETDLYFTILLGIILALILLVLYLLRLSKIKEKEQERKTNILLLKFGISIEDLYD